MLRTTISRNAQGAVEYFTQALSKEDYFFEAKNVAAYFEGKTAKRLELTGKVTKEAFTRLVNNEHPQTGERLTVRNATDRRAGYEYTFNCPKSVSVLYAITKDEEILKAHKEAVRATMREIEADMQTQANRDGHKFYDTTGNIVYAAFHHMTSRPVATKKDGVEMYVPDCHLHTHSFVFNTTFHEDKQRFQAIEEGNIRRLAPYYEAYYHSHLSLGLRKAAYSVERTHDRWEVKGIGKVIRDKFSNRTKIIEEEARLKNITDARQKSELGARTRIKKNKSVEDSKLHKLWRDRLTPDELKAIESAKGKVEGGAEKITAKEAIDRSIEHFLERQSAVPEKRVLGHALSLGYGTLSPDEVKQELAGRENILRADKQTITYITTKEMVYAEDKMIEYAAQSKGMYPPLNLNYYIKQDFLNEEQRRAIQQLLSSSDGVKILVGSAGVGKTSLLTEVKSGIQEAGKKLIAVAPSAEASRGVLESKGFRGANTIAALLKNPPDELKNNVLLIDEAGMVGVQTMQELFLLAEKQNARIILSGDPKQHTSVNFGDALRLIQEKSELKPATVNKIVRQKNEPYRKAIENLAQGETLKGFNRLDKMGAVKAIEDTDERHEVIAKEYLESVNRKESTLVISPTHAEGNALSEIIRQKLKDNEKITGPEILFETQRNLSFTEAQKKDVVNYQEGNIVQFHQNQKGGFKAGCRYEVMPKEKDGSVKVRALNTTQEFKLPLNKPENFQLYQATQTAIAQGDLIRITNNGKTLEESKINNGQTYQVKGFTKNGDIQLSTGKTLSKDYRNLQHAYVGTSHASQGKDAEHLIISQSAMSYPASNEKQWYVSASRGTKQISIYTDDKTDLKQAIQRSGDRMSANEVADQHYGRQRIQQRTNYYRQQIERKLNNGKQPEHKRSDFSISGQGRSLGKE